MMAHLTRTKILAAVALATALTLLLSTPSLLTRPTTAQVGGVVGPRPVRREVFKNPRQDELPEASHTLNAAYYSIRDNLSATLTLNNKGAEALAVQLTLFSLGGESLDLPSVTVDGGSHHVIDLREHSLAGTPFEEGSLRAVYSGKDLEMGAQVKLVDAERGLIFDEQLVEPALMFASSRLEGVWWLPSRQCDVRLVLSNTTDTALTATVRVDGLAPKMKEAASLTLAPHETRVLQVPRDLTGKRGGTLGDVGGVSVRHTGAKGALLGRALIQEAQAGYSAVAELGDPLTAKTSELHGAGLRLKDAGGEKLETVVVARNTRDAETILKGRIPYTLDDGSTGTLPLPETRLAPGETKRIDVPASSGKKALPEQIKSAGMEFEYAGDPGSVLMSAVSKSPSGRQVFRVPLIDPIALPSSTGGYPWYVEGDSSTNVYIKNVTDQPREYKGFVLHAGGAYVLEAQTVEPGQTVTIDIRALRDGQVPDANGQTIPTHATRGQFQWSMTGRENKVLIGRAEQADAASGLSSTYACANCCPNEFYEGWVTPGEVIGFPGDSTSFTAMQRDTNCYGQLYPPRLADIPYYESTDPEVASCTYYGQATARVPGFTSILARWTADDWFYWYGGYCEYTPVEVLAEAFCDVLPRVDINGPHTMKDGEFAPPVFTVTPRGAATPTGYLWSWEAPPGAGNNPSVTFASPTSSSTEARGRWFALPDQPCSPSADPNHSYFNSRYDIACEASFANGTPETVRSALTVNAYWNPAGSVAPPQITGYPAYGFDPGRNLWVVTGAGNLARVVQSPVIHIPIQSQFYNKTLAHENKHVAQWQSGMLSDLLTIPSLMAQLSPLTDATEAGLVAKINQAAVNWHDGEIITYQFRLGVVEREAYDLSDNISPRYIYQNCGRY